MFGEIDPIGILLIYVEAIDVLWKGTKVIKFGLGPRGGSKRFNLEGSEITQRFGNVISAPQEVGL
jgi:hypothetical protein